MALSPDRGHICERGHMNSMSSGGTATRRRPRRVDGRRSTTWRTKLAALSAALVAVIVPVGLDDAGAQTGGEGYWRFTSPLSVPRFDHTTNLLTTGDVLVAGGRLVSPQPLTNLASAEVWDPQTDRWRPTGSMNQARWRHTATVLPNGKVLVAGGFANPIANTNAQPVHNSAELYDPVTGQFTPTGSMQTRRGLHVAQLLTNGKVLVAGGRTCDAPPASCDFTVRTNTAEIYDPATGQFTPTGSMNVPRHTTSAVLLHNGKVLVPAGFSAPDPHDTDNTADLYDPSTGRWTLTGNLNVARARQGGMLLPDGRVVVGPGSRRTIFGPPFFSQIQTTTEFYVPGTNSWVLAGNPILPGRFNFQFTTLPNGKALMAGGWAVRREPKG